MIRMMALMALTVGACGRSAPPSCDARVARMSAHLAAPRAPTELAGVSQPLARAVAAVAAARPDQRGATAVGALVPVLAPCSAAGTVLADTGALEGGGKDAYLREHLPPAFVACRCAASPEDAGALVELWFSTWR